MARARLAAYAAAAILGMASAGAAAQLCGGGAAAGGFDDVLATSNFCTSAIWMKNRLVTQGCTAAFYCPGDVVSRASMALFMNRLGNALTPKLISVQGGANTAAPITAGNFVPLCQSSATDLPAVNYPQKVRARGTISGVFSGTAGSAAGVAFFASFNGAGFVSINASAEMLFNQPNGDQVFHWSSDVVTVPPQTTVSVAIALINRGSGSISLLAGGRCALELESFNSN